MNVELFIKQIKMNKDKDYYLKGKLAKTYVPYEEKIAACENIIRNTSSVKDETSGEVFYHRNTPACDMFFNLTLIDQYFDIEIDFANVLADYNKLEEGGYTELLLSHIPANEYVTWQKVFNWIVNDYIDNERSLISFLETRFGAMNKSLNAIAEIFKELPMNTQGE